MFYKITKAFQQKTFILWKTQWSNLENSNDCSTKKDYNYNFWRLQQSKLGGSVEVLALNDFSTSAGSGHSFLHCSGVILVHSSSSLFSSVTVMGFLAITLYSRILQRFSLGVRLGLWAGHFIISMDCWLIGQWTQGRNCMLLKEVLINIWIHSAMYLYKRFIPQTWHFLIHHSLTSLHTWCSVFPQFYNKHNVSHQTQIN